MMSLKRRQQVLIFAMALSFASAPSFAQKQTPPAGGPPKAFTLPAHESYTLANGLQVTLVPYGASPKVTASLVVRAGSVNHRAGECGGAPILGRLRKERTAAKIANQLAEKV